MVSPVDPNFTSPEPNHDDDDDFPKPEHDKDVQYTRVERLMGYAPAKRSHKWFRGAAIVILVIAVVAGGFYAAKHVHFGSKNAAKPTPVKVNTPAQTAVKTKDYTSTNFNLSLSYPQSWGVLDSGNGKLTVTSPVLQLKNMSGRSVAARAVVTIQNRPTGLPEFKTGSAVAAIDSEKISYTHPTSTQRAQTYISFLSYATTKGSGLDAIFVTGDNGYQKGQAIPESDVLKTDPLITVSFTQCADTACSSGGTALSLAATAWSDTAVSAPVKTILTSLALQ